MQCDTGRFKRFRSRSKARVEEWLDLMSEKGYYCFRLVWDDTAWLVIVRQP